MDKLKVISECMNLIDIEIKKESNIGTKRRRDYIEIYDNLKEHYNEELNSPTNSRDELNKIPQKINSELDLYSFYGQLDIYTRDLSNKLNEINTIKEDLENRIRYNGNDHDVIKIKEYKNKLSSLVKKIKNSLKDLTNLVK